MTLLCEPPRATAFAVFLEFLASLRAEDHADENIARQGHNLYREALQVCRIKHGLHYLQPGRFLCPGPRSDAPYMWFFPIEFQGEAARPDTLGGLLRDRFETYKQDMRAGFYDTHFTEFDRQVMLVDVLGALAAGQAAFEDTLRAVQDIAGSLRYGANGRVAQGEAVGVLRGTRQLLPAVLSHMSNSAVQRLAGRRIERVAFVATKADHVPALQRDNLRNLLRALADPTEARQRGAGKRPVSYHVAASLPDRR